jgi:hypothetical protein
MSLMESQELSAQSTYMDMKYPNKLFFKTILQYPRKGPTCSSSISTQRSNVFFNIHAKVQSVPQSTASIQMSTLSVLFHKNTLKKSPQDSGSLNAYNNPSSPLFCKAGGSDKGKRKNEKQLNTAE